MSGRIRFSTSILSRLGEELNPNIDQGILELVKNAYDADASLCQVSLVSDEHGQPLIIVEDDGHGMDTNDIVEGWLVLGSSKKVTSVRTPLGRRPAGNKGLGRLAALRLGRSAVMESSPLSDSSRYRVQFDWDAFDAAATVDEVLIDVSQQPRELKAHGTKIVISNLRKQISRSEVKRLARSLVLLSDPFAEDESAFRSRLYAPDYEDLTRIVEEHYFSEADYHLTASMHKGRVTAEVSDYQGKVLYKAMHEEIATSSKGALYNAPDADFDLWAFTMNSSTFSTRNSSLHEVRQWLKNFGGVHVYSNGLRVSPYGNAGNDWLDMNLSRVRNPEERPSTNNSIGRVRIDDPDGLLVQKTDRSGFIESDEYDAIRQFSIDALEWMARQRLATAEKRRRNAARENLAKSESSLEDVRKQIAAISDVGKKRDVESAFAKYDAARERETAGLRKEVQLYRTLSTAGITSATFAHESNGNPLKSIELSTTALDYGIKRDLPSSYSLYAGPINRIREATASLNVLAAATLSIIDPDKRRVSKVSLHDVIEKVVQTYDPFLRGRAVKLDLDLFDGRPYLQGTNAALESIITNLINNSLSAFERVHVEQRKILLSSRMIDNIWELSVADNGPGIVDIPLKDIWLPGETRREGGTGLGLTIVRDAVSDLGGEVHAKAHGDLGGATFVVQLEPIGVDDV